MSHIRVLVAAMPALHAGIITRIVGEQPDMSIVGEVGAGGSVREAVEQTDPDVMLVTTTGSGLPCATLELVLVRPRLRVLALDLTGGQDSLVETRHRTLPRDAWPASLADAIRDGRLCGAAGPPSDRRDPP
jgi:chemotaxis response regulator CheB